MGLSVEHIAWLNQHFGESVVYDEPMHRHTSFRIGGPADAFVTPKGKQDLVDLLVWCQKMGLPRFVLGRGTNLLVKDNGIRGVVILLDDCLNQIHHTKVDDDHFRVCAMAGVSLQRLCRYAMENGFSGLNFAVGIPGSVGGAIAMNAGTADGCMADVIETLTILDFSGQVKKVERKQLDFSYRKFDLKASEIKTATEPILILDADLILGKSDAETLKKDAELRMQRRKTTQPIHMASPGCMFKNPASGPSAGQLIDEAGLKGRCIGDAEVSQQHANYIVNHGRATAADVLALMDMVIDGVRHKFNIQLEPEVIIVGE